MRNLIAFFIFKQYRFAIVVMGRHNFMKDDEALSLTDLKPHTNQCK